MSNEKLSNEAQTSPLRNGAVIGSCFCGKPAIVYAFDTYFCQHHNDELAKSFDVRMKMPET